MTIDELARETGMTVRNIRAHQSRGLLAPPEVRGRTGYYGEGHLRRVRLIQELQGDGFSLKLIKRLVDSAGDLGDEVLRFTHAVRRPFGSAAAREIDAAELTKRWGTADSDLLRRAIELGIVRERDDGTLVEPNPRLGRVTSELAAIGIPAEAALAAGTELKRHAQGVSEVFVELFLEQVWEPFERAGMPAERWPEIRDALERLRPLAAESLLAFFELEMTEAAERAFGPRVDRISGAADGGEAP
ncbi:MAG TPA: MerR family transcriptional regulator [Solirubrobacterales bacterium]|nr:MerR family transcriptional regulator [Solirubrobacterales bacterium]